MKKLLLILLCLPLLFSTCKKEDEVTPTNTGNNNTGNSTGLTWEKRPLGADVRSGGVGVECTDGGYVIIGNYGWSSENSFLMKVNENGDVLWNETLNVLGGGVQCTSDGGYIIVGHEGTDAILIKTDGSGIEQWSQTFGGASNDYGFSVQQTADGGFIFGVENEISDDRYLIKTDGNGVEQWSHSFEGICNGMSTVHQTTDGGYIMLRLDGLIKTDGNGIEQWNQTFGGTNDDAGYSVQQTTDGGYIIGGVSQQAIYIAKTNEDGVEQWTQTITNGEEDILYDLKQTSDGGYIITGYSLSFYPNSGYLLKVDGNGVEQWSQTFGGPYATGYSVQQTTDEGYFISGNASEEDEFLGCLYLLKTDENGNY